jgi:Cu+-exporting ATPase
LRTRLLVSLVLTVPIIALSMIPPLQLTNWQWLALTLASPVVVWGALPFHRAAWANARHGAATMDALISLGVGASPPQKRRAGLPQAVVSHIRGGSAIIRHLT